VVVVLFASLGEDVAAHALNVRIPVCVRVRTGLAEIAKLILLTFDIVIKKGPP